VAAGAAAGTMATASVIQGRIRAAY